MCRLLLMTVASCMILFGIIGLYIMPKMIQQKIEQRMQLKIGTKNYDRFTKVPIPLTVKIYFFNITNSDKVLEGTERPKFEEVGPFMYKQWRRREPIDFLDHNRKLRYREYKTFYSMYPHPPPSNLTTSATNNKRHNISSSTSETHNQHQQQANNNNNNNDSYTQQQQQQQQQQQLTDVMLDPRNTNITIINLPLLTVLTTLAKLEESSVKRKLASKIASRLIADKRDKILMSRPANELLFDGTRVNFMDSAKDLVSDVLGFNFDSPLPNNKFGFFYMKNNTWNRRENGELTVFTGRNDSMSDFMLIENWNDLKRLQVWPTNTEAGDRCNEIRGTDGSQFHPGVRRDQALDLFSPLVCTSLQVVYKEDTKCRDIPLMRFITPSELFAAPRKNPRNACYCTVPRARHLSGAVQTKNSPLNDSRCYLDGLMDLSLCQKGAPIAASSPHFYNADPMLAMAAGLKPDKEIHQTYLDIEPMTGAVMRAASRAQINAYVDQSALDVIDSSVIGHMTPMVAPLFWLEEAAEIDEKSSREFKGQLLSLVQRAHRSFVYAIVLGIILALLVSLQYWYVTCYSIDMDELHRQKLERRRRLREKQRRAAGQAASAAAKSRGAAGHLGGGARHSNRENMEKPMLLDSVVQFVEGEEDEESSSSSAASDTAKAALPVVVAAAVLGAASAGPSSTRRQRRHQSTRAADSLERRPRSAGRPLAAAAAQATTAAPPTNQAAAAAAKSASEANDDADDACNEEELSRKMLVANEWKPGNGSEATAAGGQINSGSDVAAVGRPTATKTQQLKSSK